MIFSKTIFPIRGGRSHTQRQRLFWKYLVVDIYLPVSASLGVCLIFPVAEKRSSGIRPSGCGIIPTMTRVHPYSLRTKLGDVFIEGDPFKKLS